MPAARRPAPAQRPGPLDRRPGRGVDLSARRARAGQAELRAATGDRELPDPTRYRKAKIEERTREVQRLEKVLQDAGIKLSSVAPRCSGSRAGRCSKRSSRAPTTPRRWPSWPRAHRGANCPGCVRCSRAASPAPRGHRLLDARLIDFLDETVAMLSERVEELVTPFSRQVELLDTIPASTGAAPSCCWPSSAPTCRALQAKKAPSGISKSAANLGAMSFRRRPERTRARARELVRRARSHGLGRATATRGWRPVTATAPMRLLVLEPRHLNRLMTEAPALAARVRDAMRSRLATV